MVIAIFSDLGHPQTEINFGDFTTEIDSPSFQMTGGELKCLPAAALDVGTYVFNLIATQTDNEWRYSSMPIFITISEEKPDPIDLDTIITPPDDSLDWKVSPYGPAYVKSGDEIMAFTVAEPEGQKVRLSSNDNDFAIDNFGRVIYVGSPSLFTVRK